MNNTGRLPTRWAGAPRGILNLAAFVYLDDVDQKRITRGVTVAGHPLTWQRVIAHRFVEVPLHSALGWYGWELDVKLVQLGALVAHRKETPLSVLLEKRLQIDASLVLVVVARCWMALDTALKVTLVTQT